MSRYTYRKLVNTVDAVNKIMGHEVFRVYSNHFGNKVCRIVGKSGLSDYGSHGMFSPRLAATMFAIQLVDDDYYVASEIVYASLRD